jgi:transcriptional regulator with XRE-family HTH domain
MKRRPNVKAQFGKRLRGLRLDAGLSQEQLADKAALDRSYVGGVERGERNISLENICKLSTALGCTPSRLLDFSAL